MAGSIISKIDTIDTVNTTAQILTGPSSIAANVFSWIKLNCINIVYYSTYIMYIYRMYMVCILSILSCYT